MKPVGDQVLLLCGVQPETWMHGYEVVGTWLEKGADPFLDIFPTVTRLLQTKTDFEPPRSAGGLKYFTKAIAKAYAQRLANGADASMDEVRGVFGTGDWPGFWAQSEDQRKWGNRLKGLVERDVWLTHYGPRPGEELCQAPKDLIEEFLAIISAGQEADAVTMADDTNPESPRFLEPDDKGGDIDARLEPIPSDP